jgi:hypothetical protein
MSGVTGEENGGGVFLALVGLQPAATALLLKSWVAAKGAPETIRLLATAHVERTGVAERLRKFCASLAPNADCQVIRIAPGLDDADGLPSATRWVRDFLAARGRKIKLIFAGDPGPAFLVAAVARLLPPDAVLLHADSDCCWAFTRWDGAEMYQLLQAENLGLEALLALYGLTATELPQRLDPVFKEAVDKMKLTIPDRMRRGLVFQGLPDGAGLPVLELAFEARGRLYGLCAATGKDILQRVREIERLPLSLKNVNPRISVYCPDPLQRRRIRAAGLEPLSDRALRGWVQLGRVLPPGYAVERDMSGPIELSKPLRGGGGEGEPLLVWMGAEPGATLASIWTHRPRQLVLLYDRQTPRTVEMVRNLAECRALVPAGGILLLESDHLGRHVSRRIRENFSAAKADVSPGTKVQTEVFARLPGLELWSLRPPHAAALEGGATLPLQSPDLLTLARIHGGRLHRRSRPVNARRWDQRQIRFLLLLGQALARAPRRWCLDPVPEFELPSASLTRQSNGTWKVCVRGQTAQGTLPADGGAWLERVVAAALVNAGADEVFLNLRWDWPPGVSVPEEGPRDELDVAARLGPHLFAVSCKLRAKGVSLRKQAAEVEAVARTCLGRFAVPAVVRVRLGGRPVPEKGAIFFDLAAVVSEDFRARLDAAVRARRTLES